MELQNNWYVYRHIRLDKNEPFYIGIGCRKDFKRAYDKGKRRSLLWNKIVNKTNYDVEIIFEDVSKSFACEKEIELILLYGRKDLKNGSLVNLTIGGEAPPVMFGDKNIMKQQKYKDIISYKMTGRIMSKETKLKISLSLKNKNIKPPSQKGIKRTKKSILLQIEKTKGEKSVKAKKVIDTKSGKIWGCAKDCALDNELKYSTLINKLNGFRKNNTTYEYFYDK